MQKLIIKLLFAVLGILILLFNPLSARLMTVIAGSVYDMNVPVFYRQIGAESSFCPLAESSKGAVGLGQIKYETAVYVIPGINKTELWLPWYNLKISAMYNKYLLKRYNGNYTLALAAYNWGETNVDKKLKESKITKVSSDTNYRELFKNIPETYAFIGRILEKK